jgi:hypothetical protein
MPKGKYNRHERAKKAKSKSPWSKNMHTMFLENRLDYVWIDGRRLNKTLGGVFNG